MSAPSRLALAVSLVLAAILLIWHSLFFNFVTDDAFISFVYAKNLVSHGALVFNIGERVEGYTNFLWTLIIAAGLGAKIPAELSSRVLGTLCAVLTMFYLAWLMRRLRDGEESLWDTASAWILAGIPGYACWSSGGLETQLFALLCTLSLGQYILATVDEGAGHRPRLWGIGVTLGLAALTRPEGYLLFALLGLHRLVGKLRRGELLPSKEEFHLLLMFLLLTVPHMAWRRWYYGYFVPNTFFIKSSGGKGTWEQGGYYLKAVARDLKLPILPLFYLGGFLRPWTDADSPRLRDSYRAIGQVLLVWVVPFCLYVASVGGDFMGLYRFIMPTVPLLVLGGVLGLVRLLAGQKIAVSATVLTVFFGLHAVNSYFIDRHALTFIGADRGIDTPGYLRHYTADRAAIGKWLGQHAKPDDYQVVGGAGAQVYYAGIRALDSFGLSDEYVAHKVAAVSNRPGHQKFAPLDYVLSRKPTILTYNVYRIAAQPYRPSQQEAAEWRARGFHYVSVQIPGLSQPWYSFLKRIDRALGPLPPETDISH